MLLLFIRIVKQALTECQKKIFIDYLRMVIKKGFVLFIQTAPLLDFLLLMVSVAFQPL
jgi:hypothetical protein